MQRAAKIIRSFRRPGLAVVVLLSSILWATSGCGIAPTDDDPNNDPGNGDSGVVRELVNFDSNFSVSDRDAAVSVLYNVEGTPDSISGYYVEVENGNAGSAHVSDVVVVPGALTAGFSQFTIDPKEVGLGFFRAGLIVVEDGVELPGIESTGTMHVQGSPDPYFILPDVPTVEVTKGDPVTILFDAGDPEGVVQWRLFHLPNRVCVDDTIPSEVGLLEIETGDGNIGEGVLDTSPLQPGDYALGVMATDTGSSVADAIAYWPADRVIVKCGSVVRVVSQSPTP